MLSMPPARGLNRGLGCLPVEASLLYKRVLNHGLPHRWQVLDEVGLKPVHRPGRCLGDGVPAGQEPGLVLSRERRWPGRNDEEHQVLVHPEQFRFRLGEPGQAERGGEFVQPGAARVEYLKAAPGRGYEVGFVELEYFLMSGDPRKSKVPRGELLGLAARQGGRFWLLACVDFQNLLQQETTRESALFSREFWKYDRFKPCNLSLSRLSDST